MVYILTNFDTTLEQDIYRIQLCRELNISPYPMIYDKEHCEPVYRKLQRWCSNFIFWSVPTFEEYQRRERKEAAIPRGMREPLPSLSGSEHTAIEYKSEEQVKEPAKPSGRSRADDLAELRRRLMKGKDENT